TVPSHRGGRRSRPGLADRRGRHGRCAPRRHARRADAVRSRRRPPQARWSQRHAAPTPRRAQAPRAVSGELSETPSQLSTGCRFPSTESRTPAASWAGGEAMKAHISLGRRGAEAAVDYLAGLGWTVVERNWRGDDGEIDIVAHDGRGHVVCEVKTRGSSRFGDPLEAITPDKAARLHRLARRWA